MNALVSVIILCYNVELYLKQCLESVIDQTYKDLEIICINDGSTDSTLAILNSFLTDHQIKIVNQENSGVSRSRNVGLKMASGKYVYFLDADDYIEPELIEKCVTAAEEKDLDIVQFNAKIFYDNSEARKKRTISEELFCLKNEYKAEMTGKEMFCCLMENKEYDSPVWLRFYKKSFLIDNDLLFVDNILNEDEFFTFAVFQKAMKISVIPERFINYRIREASIMSSDNYDLRLVSGLVTIRKVFEMIPSEKITDRYVMVLEQWFNTQLRHTRNRKRRLSKELSSELFDTNFDRIFYDVFIEPQLKLQNRIKELESERSKSLIVRIYRKLKRVFKK